MADELARILRKTMTPQEVKLWVRLRALRSEGHHFRRQSSLGKFIVDFECRRARLVVEVDGSQHSRAIRSQRDKHRTAILAQMGYRVLRFWNNDIDARLDAVLEVISSDLTCPQPHPSASRTPSPEEEGGSANSPPRSLASARGFRR